MASGCCVLHGGDVEAELEARPAPGHPDHPVAEDLLGQPLPVGRGGHRDAAVGVQVVDVGRVDQAVHGGVDGGSRGTAPVQAEVEGGHHLVFAFFARVDVDQRAQPVEPQHGQTLTAQRAEVAARALDPEQLDGVAGDRVDPGALGGRVPAAVVGVPRVGAEPVRAGEQLVGDARPSQAPQPACVPPTRSLTIRSW